MSSDESLKPSKKRIVGLDVARAIAVVGMIIVNFKVVLGDKGMELLKSISSVFDGKAAATFVVLAGVGLALMSQNAIDNEDKAKLQRVKVRISKRALFLFVIGLSYIVIWPADILHFYGNYMIFSLLLINASSRLLKASVWIFILSFPILMLVVDYEIGWNFNTLEYNGFWTIKGFITNLFYNGFHPVIPWTAFMLSGMWLGRQNLRDEKNNSTLLRRSLLVFVILQIVSFSLVKMMGPVLVIDPKELEDLIGTNPMPPLPMYMLSGIAIAFVVILSCINLANKLPNNSLIQALVKTGQMALTFYVAHVVIGMGLIDWIYPNLMGTIEIQYSVLYAILFSITCVIVAKFWLERYKMGPLEWIMRKITG